MNATTERETSALNDPIETTLLTVHSPTSIAIMTPLEAMLANAKELVVADEQMAEIANEELRAILRRKDELDKERKGITKDLDTAKQKIMDKYRPALEALETAAGYIKNALLSWTKKAEAERRAEEARLQEIARKEADKLAAQAAKAESKGQVEKAAMLTQAAAATAAAVPIMAPTAKLAGSSMRKTYSAKVVDKGRAITALLANPMLAAAVVIDESALNKLAANFKEQFNVDGCELVITEGLTTRR